MKCKGCGAELVQGALCFMVHQLAGGFLVSAGPLDPGADVVKAALAIAGSLQCADKCARELQANIRRRVETARWN